MNPYLHHQPDSKKGGQKNEASKLSHPSSNHNHTHTNKQKSLEKWGKKYILVDLPSAVRQKDAVNVMHVYKEATEAIMFMNNKQQQQQQQKRHQNQ